MTEEGSTPTSGGEGEGPRGPEFEVWNHLESGWQMAYDDMARQLPHETMNLFEGLAEALVEMNTRLLVPENDPSAANRLRSLFPDTDLRDVTSVLQRLFKSYLSGKNPWLRHAVELEVASKGIMRATGALERFALLAPRFSQRPMPERAQPYLEEVVSTFLFGFDPACIALCRSALEQVAKALLVERGTYTDARLKREQSTAGTLVEELKRAGLLKQSYDAAKRVIDRGGTVVHRHIFEAKILREQARSSIEDLVDVLATLLS